MNQGLNAWRAPWAEEESPREAGKVLMLPAASPLPSRVRLLIPSSNSIHIVSSSLYIQCVVQPRASRAKLAMVSASSLQSCSQPEHGCLCVLHGRHLSLSSQKIYLRSGTHLPEAPYTLYTWMLISKFLSSFRYPRQDELASI